MKDVGESDDTSNFWIVTIIEYAFDHNEFVFRDDVDFLYNLEHSILFINN